MGVFLELVGTQCSGKTRLAVELSSRYGFSYYPVEAEECWRVWSGRQYCFAVVMASSWLAGVAGAVGGGMVVVDNSLLGVAGYSRFFGESMVEKHALSAWRSIRSILASTGVRHIVVLVKAHPSVLAERCLRRGRDVSGWEAETAVAVQDAIERLLDELAGRGELTYHTVVNHGLDEALASIAGLVGV